MRGDLLGEDLKVEEQQDVADIENNIAERALRHALIKPPLGRASSEAEFFGCRRTLGSSS
jgi:hypothetical protein